MLAGLRGWWPGRRDLEDTGTRMERANAYADAGKLGQAIKEYNMVIRLRPKYIDAYLNRGYAYFNMGDGQRAVEDFSEAIRLAPSLGGAHARRALAYALMGQEPEAVADVERARKLGFDVDSLEGAVRELKRLN